MWDPAGGTADAGKTMRLFGASYVHVVTTAPFTVTTIAWGSRGIAESWKLVSGRSSPPSALSRSAPKFDRSQTSYRFPWNAFAISLNRTPTPSAVEHRRKGTMPAKLTRSSAPCLVAAIRATYSETGRGLTSSLASSASLTARIARRASSRKKPAFPSAGKGVPGAFVEVLSGGVSAATAGSRKRSSQWQVPTAVLAKRTLRTLGVEGVSRRGLEPSTGKNRPASPPEAPPGHCVNPDV